jgi:GTP-binding protein
MRRTLVSQIYSIRNGRVLFSPSRSLKVFSFSALFRRNFAAIPSASSSSPTSASGPSPSPESDGALIKSSRKVRNLAVIAHVDHGKTSLVDRLVKTCQIDLNEVLVSMDSNPLERERGITILSKVTSVQFNGHTVNIVDTPGHSDFGGEVERVMHMVDGVLLVVDALEGPMPQTRYVLSKALAKGLKPVVVFNKCDREGARLGVVENEVFDLFVDLEATDEQLDFPIVYASAREGWTVGDVEVAKDPSKRDAVGKVNEGGTGMTHLLDTILTAIPAPRILEGPFRMLVTQMEMDSFVGKMVLGRVASGSVKLGDAIVSITREGERKEEGKVLKLFSRRGLAAIPLQRAEAGDIVQLAGLQTPIPTSTVAAAPVVRPLFADPIDPPTISMSFSVNDSPLAGREGTQLTSSMISERLAKEAAGNVALVIQSGVQVRGMPDATEVRGRGELQLSVLIETMRREGFELSVSPPAVLFRKDPDTGKRQEPYEEVVVDVDNEYSGVVIEKMAIRKGNLREFAQAGAGKVRLNFLTPSRGLIGFQSEIKTDSRGTAVLHRRFESYGDYIPELERKARGVMCSNTTGSITAYALDSLQVRGQLFVAPGTDTYMGHIIGECSKDDRDMDVNPVKAKKLTNIRSAGNDEQVRLSPPRLFSLEEAIVYVAPDELVEVTPTKIRLRKRVLDIDERSRFAREFAKSTR